VRRAKREDIEKILWRLDRKLETPFRGTSRGVTKSGSLLQEGSLPFHFFEVPSQRWSPQGYVAEIPRKAPLCEYYLSVSAFAPGPNSPSFSAFAPLNSADRFCLDGGGVRGYSMLILLHDFMHKTYAECNDEPPEPDKIPKPCEYFDLIAGTGTGGLIAIMLGRLRMNTKDCMRVYVQMTRKVFETDKTIAGIPYRSTLFKASMLEDAIRACVRSFEHERDENPDDVFRDMPNSPGSLSMESRPQSMMSDKNGMPRTSTSSSPKNRYSHFSADNWTTAGDPNASLEDTRREKRCKTLVAS